MEQIKLLNFHKVLSNLAYNLVGGFVALLVYQATHNIVYSITYLVANQTFVLLFVLLLKKFFNKYPQILLLFRVIPFVLSNVFLFVMDTNLIVGVVFACIFFALDYAISNLSKEIILNYSSLNEKNDRTLGVTRLFEKIGVMIALVAGGFLLDIDKRIVLTLSICLYIISVIPLVMFYIKFRKSQTFNKDATSNAIDTLNKNEKLKTESIKLTKKLLFTYFWVYFSFAFVDILQNSFGLYVYFLNGEFATAGILNAIFNCFYAVGSYVAGYANEKFDTTKLVSISSVIIAICVVTLPFVDVNKLFILICVLYAAIAFFYTFISHFVLERVLVKSRIMACSNEALYVREAGCDFAYIIGYAFGFFGLIGIFIATSVTMLASSLIIPYCEEKTRKNLVDYLQNNEKIENQKRKSIYK